MPTAMNYFQSLRHLRVKKLLVRGRWAQLRFRPHAALLRLLGFPQELGNFPLPLEARAILPWRDVLS